MNDVSERQPPEPASSTATSTGSLGASLGAAMTRPSALQANAMRWVAPSVARPLQASATVPSSATVPHIVSSPRTPT